MTGDKISDFCAECCPEHICIHHLIQLLRYQIKGNYPPAQKALFQFSFVQADSEILGYDSVILR